VTTLSFVTTSERPDLTAVTGVWRWNAFFSDGETSQDDLMARERAGAADPALLPTVFVMLDGDEPVGMVALCEDDLEDRPDLDPWLAGLYVAPAHRGKGHARTLISKIEAVAADAGIERLSLYTASAVELYRSAGWTTAETFDRDGAQFHIMRKFL
jgi:GNAT superfamily N-acetyltransferase